MLRKPQRSHRSGADRASRTVVCVRLHRLFVGTLRTLCRRAARRLGSGVNRCARVRICCDRFLRNDFFGHDASFPKIEESSRADCRQGFGVNPVGRDCSDPRGDGARGRGRIRARVGGQGETRVVRLDSLHLTRGILDAGASRSHGDGTHTKPVANHNAWTIRITGRCGGGGCADGGRGGG